MQQYDVRLKSILHKAMPRLLRILGLPGVAEYLTVEFPVREKALPDLVVRLIDEWILHIELQSKNDSRMIWRGLDYWQVINELWPDSRIVQVVIYLGDGPVTMISEVHRGRLHYGFDILNLQEVEAQDFLESESDDERMLAALCRTDDPRATIAAILGSWKHLPVKEISERVGDLFVLSQLRKRGTMVMEEARIMPVDLDIRDNELFKWGEEEGITKGEAKVLARFLARRFGPLPETIRTKIASADIESLDRWADRMDLAQSLDAVFGD